MKRLLQLSIVGLTLGTGYLATASAFAGPDGARSPQAIVERLTEKLGLDPGTAEDVAEIMLESKAQKKSIRESVRAEAKALKAAYEAGDERGMQKSMDKMADAKEELQAIKKDTRERISAQLTVEQRAKIVLNKMDKKRRAHRAKKGKNKSQD